MSEAPEVSINRVLKFAKSPFCSVEDHDDIMAVLRTLEAETAARVRYEATLKSILGLKSFGADADALGELIVDIRMFARVALSEDEGEP